ncbi:MAG: response regulator transcription factor [Planctomycetota bacterium]
MVEDDPAIQRGLCDALHLAGYATLASADAEDGTRTALGAALDLVVLDLMLPDGCGFEVLAQIRASRPALPVICVTARGEEADRVQGLRGGADDYVVKPFSATELLARVEAVLRRSAERPLDLRHADIPGGRRVDFERQEVQTPDGSRTLLSEREAQLLRYLACRPGRAVCREELLRHVWGLDPTGLRTRTVDMLVARLRDKLGDGDPAVPPIIVTVRGRGYMLALPPAAGR